MNYQWMIEACTTHFTFLRRTDWLTTVPIRLTLGTFPFAPALLFYYCRRFPCKVPVVSQNFSAKFKRALTVAPSAMVSLSFRFAAPSLERCSTDRHLVRVCLFSLIRCTGTASLLVNFFAIYALFLYRFALLIEYNFSHEKKSSLGHMCWYFDYTHPPAVWHAPHGNNSVVMNFWTNVISLATTKSQMSPFYHPPSLGWEASARRPDSKTQVHVVRCKLLLSSPDWMETSCTTHGWNPHSTV